jgi:BirA family biotin operon repressor/biotin-[acetyl-CoA-carboxylase] ligase
MSTLGQPRVHLRRTDSTNERARVLAGAGAPHGTLVTAAEQTAGRGRQGRVWSAPPGSSLLMSLVLREPPSLLPLIAAIAVCDVAGGEARIKWPNDVVLERTERSDVKGSTEKASGAGGETGSRAPTLAKLAGILAEGRPQQGWAVLGIGLNVAVRLEDLPAELRLTAASLEEPAESIEPTLEQLLGSLRRRLEESSEETLLAWRTRDVLLGREISWAQGQQRGRAAGIDGAGRLVVSLADGGRATLDAGEVHLESIQSPEPKG